VTDNVTLSDVARAAGVSLATASRAVNGNAGRGGRSPDHRRVAQIAADLGYVPDASAQAVARGRTSVLGLVVSDITDLAITNTLYDVVATAAETNGLSPSMASAGGRADQLVARVRDMHRQRARSLVVAAVDGHDLGQVPGLRTALDAFARSGGNACTLGFAVEGTSSVTIDETGGARSLATMLFAAGYRRPAVVTGSDADSVHQARLRGLLTGFAENSHAVRPELVLGQVDAYAATRRALTQAETRPDVVVCVSPLETTRVADAVLDEGLLVATDLGAARVLPPGSDLTLQLGTDLALGDSVFLRFRTCVVPGGGATRTAISTRRSRTDS
jgi:LacI family transcriptional regulator